MPPTTHVVGNLFVIHDPDAALITTVGGQQALDRIGIYDLLRETYGDDYDVVSIYIDVGSGMPSLGSASGSIFNDVSGIGRWPFDNRSQYRSSAKLQHLSHFSFFDLVTLLHEFGHRWLAFVNYAQSPGGPTEHLLHEDWIWTAGGEGQHWGRWVDNENSSMDYDQAEWIDNGDGTFNRIDRQPTDPAHEEWFGYSLLDQYLMGLVPASAVPPTKIIQDPSPALSELGPQGVPTGPYTPNPGVLSVPLAWIQNPKMEDPHPFWSGPRTPDYLNSQRVFHEAVVILTKDSDLASAFVTDSESWRTKYTKHFRKATAGRAMVDTSLLGANHTDLYVRDNVTDTGDPTSSPPFWLSPDLWVRNSDDGEMPGNNENQVTVREQSNWIYGRVHNKGSEPYESVTVNFYLANFRDLAPGTEFLYPEDWNPDGLLGSATIPVVPAGGSAIAKIEWTSDKIPEAMGWHPCLLCEVIPMEVAPSGLHHVFENRKLAQRNLTIIDPPMGGTGSPMGGGAQGGYSFTYEFWVGHPLRPAQGSRLRLWTDRERDDVQLFLDPAGLVKDIGAHGEVLEWDVPLDATRVPTAPQAMRATTPQDASEKPWPRIGARRADDFRGLTLAIRKGTEFGVGPSLSTGEPGLEVRFEDDVRIQIGARSSSPLEERYKMRGLRPVILNGLPLLHVTNPEDASLLLPLAPHQRHKLRLIGIVRGGGGAADRTVFHIGEELAGRVLGGVSLAVGT